MVVSVLNFYESDPELGIVQASALAKRHAELYSIGLLPFISLKRIRSWTATPSRPRRSQYTRFLFSLKYIRHQLDHEYSIFDWIDYEWKKLSGIGKYDELFMLRNMTWSLGQGLLNQPGISTLARKKIDAIDLSIIKLLKKKTGGMQPRPRAGLKRIAICAGLLRHSKQGMHARLVLEYARNLAATYPDLQILVLVTNEIPFKGPLQSFSMHRMTPTYRAGLDKLAKRILGEVACRVEFQDLELANADWQDLYEPMKVLMNFDPDVIMHFGSKMRNESFIVRRALYRLYPTAYFFSQMTNLVDRYNDIYLARNSHPLCGDYDVSRVRVAPPPLRAEIILHESEGKLSRYKAGHVKKSLEEVTIVSVLSGTRMRDIFVRYGPVLRGRIMDILDAPTARWILVGPEDPQAVLEVDPRFRKLHEEGKLDVISFDENLSAFYEHCDLFLHLPLFTGGAGGLFMAVMAGLPALCFSNTDAATRIDPEFVFEVEDIEGFLESARKLIESAELRKKKGAACRNYFHDVGVQELSVLTYSALNEAVATFNRRIDISL